MAALLLLATILGLGVSLDPCGNHAMLRATIVALLLAAGIEPHPGPSHERTAIFVTFPQLTASIESAHAEKWVAPRGFLDELHQEVSSKAAPLVARAGSGTFDAQQAALALQPWNMSALRRLFDMKGQSAAAIHLANAFAADVRDWLQFYPPLANWQFVRNEQWLTVHWEERNGGSVTTTGKWRGQMGPWNSDGDRRHVNYFHEFEDGCWKKFSTGKRQSRDTSRAVPAFWPPAANIHVLSAEFTDSSDTLVGGLVRKIPATMPAYVKVEPAAPKDHRVTWSTEYNPGRTTSLDTEKIPTHTKIEKRYQPSFVNRVRQLLRGYTAGDEEAKAGILDQMLSFPKNFLRSCSGTGKRQSALALKQQLSGGVVTFMPDTAAPKLSDDARAAKKASFHCRNGYRGKAARTLDQSANKFGFVGDEFLTAISDLHPNEKPLTEQMLATLRSQAPDVQHPLTVTEVREACNRLCSGATPGPTGWSDELIATLLSDDEAAREATTIIDDIRLNHLDAEAAARLVAAKFIPLPKEAKKIRPIAIGESWLKLACTCQLHRVMPEVRALFSGLQFGVGEKGGAEHIAHHVRAIFEERSDATICTLDCTNAFNSVNRLKVAQALLAHPQFASLIPLFLLEYGQPSRLYGDGFDNLWSRSGVRQGSVLGPFWFALTIHAEVEAALKRHPAVKGYLYLDDVTLVGPPQSVAAASADIEKALEPLGLMINRKKSEWLSRSNAPPPAGFTTPESIRVLGAFIGSDEACSNKLRALEAKQTAFFRRLGLVDSDAALAILQASGIPRASFIARTHRPAVSSSYLADFDAKVIRAWSDMSETATDPSTATRLLAHLPTDLGGCGLTSHLMTAPDAYAASFETAMGISNVTQANRSLATNIALQKQLADETPEMAAHLAETSKAGTATWMADGGATRFSPQAYGAALRHRLRAPHRSLPERMTCPGCLFSCDGQSFSAHVVGCARLRGHNASSRHATVKRTIEGILRTAAVPSDGTEPREYGADCCPGCHLQLDADTTRAHIATCASITPKQRAAGTATARRTGPDGRCYLGGAPVVYDVTVVSPTAPSYIRERPDTAMARRVQDKNKAYGDAVAAAGEEFVVFGATAFGHLSSTSSQLISRIVANSPTVSRKEACWSLSTCIALETGQVLIAAERRLGVIHATVGRSSPPRPPPSSPPPPPPAQTAGGRPEATQRFLHAVERQRAAAVIVTTQTASTTSGRVVASGEDDAAK